MARMTDGWRRENQIYEQVISVFNFLNPIVVERVNKFIAWAEEDTNKNFARLDINMKPEGKGKRFTGQLYNNLEWTTWNACGGDVQVFQVVFAYYAKFVELALQRNHKLINIPAIDRIEWQPIPRPDNKPRRAKPFVSAEMRKQGKKLERDLLRYYAYTGSMYVAYSIRPTDDNGLTQAEADEFNATIFVPDPEAFTPL